MESVIDSEFLAIYYRYLTNNKVNYFIKLKINNGLRMATAVAVTVATRYSRLFIGLVLIVLFTAIGHGRAAGFFCLGGPEVWLSIFLLL